MPRLGILGTLVWDTIIARDPGRGAPVEEWGGIAYALSAFDAAAAEGWSCFPIVKVGSDLRGRADAFLRGLGRIDSLDGVRTVPEPNNRVELHYRDSTRRCERLRGGVPGWSAEEVTPLARACDALYVNFIAGWELDLAAVRALRGAVRGPLYADIHSLLLGVGPDGVRAPRPLERWREWLGSFDLVQMNEDELRTLAADRGDPWRLAAEAIGPATRALLVTLGERGAAYVTTAEFLRSGRLKGAPEAAEGERLVRPAGAAVSARVEAEHRVPGGDPTGCGDVWGVTCFASLLAGDPLEEAMRRANRFAARNAGFRGASGLAEALRSESGLLRNGVREGR